MQRLVIPSTGFDGSTGLIAEWQRLGLAEIRTSKSPFIWWGGVGDVLLYHKDTLWHLTENLKYRVGLFGNPSPPNNGRKNYPWIYWPRRIDLVGQYHAIKQLGYRSRRFNCSFIGGYENEVQRSHRPFNYWRPACDLFEVFGSRKSPCTLYTNSEYIRLLRQSRYGLCLRGYGGKCQRDMECLAVGTVPIFTPGCNTDYFDRLRLGVHYLSASSPQEIAELIRDVSVEQWQSMSKAGTDWFTRNVSPQGAFDTTRRIVDFAGKI